MSICVITAIYGNYELKCHPFVKQNVECDFICFTDNQNIESNGWIINTHPYHLQNKYKNYVNSYDNNKHSFNTSKYYKTQFIYIDILNKYDYIIWVDGTIEIKTEYFVNKLLQHKEYTVTLFTHLDNYNMFEETIIGLTLDKYINPLFLNQNQPIQDLFTQYLYYLNNGCNNNITSFNTTIMLFNISSIELTMLLSMWYSHIIKYSTQDQLSFLYCNYKLNINTFRINENFNKYVNYHKHGYLFICD